jgi:hypothetical protein
MCDRRDYSFLWTDDKAQLKAAAPRSQVQVATQNRTIPRGAPRPAALEVNGARVVAWNVGTKVALKVVVFMFGRRITVTDRNSVPL